MRKIIQQIIPFHHLRLADLSKDQQRIEEITNIRVADLEDLPSLDTAGQKDGIGFKFG